MRRFWSGTFASLAVRHYRLFFVGQAVSVTGVWMQRLALAWLVLELTDSGAWLGTVVAVTQIPTLFFGAWAGVLADRHDKRRLLMWVSAAGVLPSVALGAMSSVDDVSMYLVLLAALALGVVDCLERPARQSFPSEMVGTDLLANAVTLNQVIQDIGKAVGPAIAALTIALFGLATTFYINAATFLAVLLGLVLMRPAELHLPERRPRQPGEAREGFAYVRRSPHLLGPVLLLFAVGLVAYNHQVMIPLLARDTFDGGADHAGYLLAALGLGAVLGGLALAGVLRPTPRRIVSSAVVLAVLFAAIAVAPSFEIALVLVFLMGTFSLVFKTLSSSWLQLTSVPTMRGRVVSLLIIAIAGTSPIGAPLVGWVASQFGTREAFLLAGVLSAVSAAVAYAYLSRRGALGAPALWRTDLHTGGAAPVPDARRIDDPDN